MYSYKFKRRRYFSSFSQLTCQCNNRYFQAVCTEKDTMHLRFGYCLDILYIVRENFPVLSTILMHWTLLDGVWKAGFVLTLRRGNLKYFSRS